MNHDVDDSIKRYYSRSHPVHSTSNSNLKSEQESISPTIISRLKSLFSQTADIHEANSSEPARIHAISHSRRTSSRFSSGLSVNDIYRNHANSDSSTHARPREPNPSFLDMSGAPNGATVNRFSDVKRILTNLTIPTRHVRIESGDSSIQSSSRSPRSAFFPAHSPTSSTFTPPLTPDSFNGLLLSPAAFSEYEEHGRYQYRFQEQESSQDHHQGAEVRKEIPTSYSGIHIHEENHTIRRPLSHLEDIKEGKKPARAISYDALIADISNETAAFITEEPSAGDSDDEWYGMEYTIELSKRDRRGSESTDPTSGGEHSKSHESWAAIHQGTTHAVSEDDEYHTWKRWHRYLDKQEERQRKKKALKFIAHAEDLAYIFLEEMRTRDWIRWEAEQGLPSEDNIGIAKDHLYLLAHNRLDPYFPAHKHNLAWYLKKSRSLGCIRELCPVPALGDDERDWLEQLEHTPASANEV